MKSNGQFKIEKKIPIPKARTTGFSNALRNMKIGDSFFMETTPSNLATTAAAMGLKGCFSQRKVEGGHRVWRIK